MSSKPTLETPPTQVLQYSFRSWTALKLRNQFQNLRLAFRLSLHRHSYISIPNEAAAEKKLKYRADYNNNPPVSTAFMPAIARTSGRLHSEFIRLLFLQAHRETDSFFAASGVQPVHHTSGGIFHFKRAAFLSQLKAKVGSSLAKTAAMCVNLNIDGAPITSRSHTHPSHSQASRLLTSSLSLGVPVPRTMECIDYESTGVCHSNSILVLWFEFLGPTRFVDTINGVGLLLHRCLGNEHLKQEGEDR